VTAAVRATGPDRPAPLPRIIAVELRKLVDTRAGTWLLAGTGLGAVVLVGVLAAVPTTGMRTPEELLWAAQLPAVVVLPVLGVLAMAGEWSQRTALTTFALVPRRGRVLAGKLAAAALVAVAAAVATVPVAVLGGLAAGLPDAGPPAPAVLAQCALQLVVFVLMGSAFGALLMSTPLAVAGYFVLPTAWTLLSGLVPGLAQAAAWLDTAATTAPLSEAALTGAQWARLAVSVAVWVALPLAAGWLRLRRREIS
jgi:ABC-type transport system involved in multi-copper enzyme maturation permease subunit